MAVGRQSPAASLPPLSQKQINTTTWGTTGNTSSVITDEYVHLNSVIIVWTAITSPGAQPTGRWSTIISNGSFYLVSSDSENSTLPISYIVL